MLKGKRSVSACSLSSCRLRAEALARAFNNRIWPCMWVSQRPASERDDLMSNGIENEEEFFDASPSSVEFEDESLFCQQHSSAATEAGRTKLYELLQQHANDDATDVFYDVGENATLSDTACDTCLNVDAEESGQVSCESYQNSTVVKDETYLLNNLDGVEVCNNFTAHENNQSNENRIKAQNSDSDEIGINDTNYQEVVLDSSECNSSSICNEHVSNESAINGQDCQNSLESESVVIEKIAETLSKTDNEKSALNETNDLDSDETLVKNDRHDTEIENKEIIELPPSDAPSDVEHDASFMKIEKHPRALSKPLIDDDIDDAVENETVQVTIDTGSPPNSSDSSEAKPVSPLLSRLQVFEDPRPKIIRSTSLKTGKTPPGTPSRKKIVRFADVLGLDLEDVRHIMTGDVPTIPSSAYTDLNLKDADLPTCDSTSAKVEVNRQISAGWQVVQGSTHDFYPLFLIPGEQSDFLERVRQQGICLESVTVSEVNVQCTCRVVNYGFHKKVVARYTVNDWLSFNDINASFLGSSGGDTDNFAFSIFLSPLNRSLKFALKYEVNGKEYWDNNRNQNYCFGYHGSNNHVNFPTTSLPSLQHEFW